VCADGQKQRVYKSKEESSSPTVAIESLFLTAVIIDAKEQRDVITCDSISGAFLHADIDEVLHMHSVLKARWQNFWWRSIQIYMGHA
jgi:hypothetical protein